jgi:hypothetical protein
VLEHKVRAERRNGVMGGLKLKNGGIILCGAFCAILVRAYGQEPALPALPAEVTNDDLSISNQWPTPEEIIAQSGTGIAPMVAGTNCLFSAFIMENPYMQSVPPFDGTYSLTPPNTLSNAFNSPYCLAGPFLLSGGTNCPLAQDGAQFHYHLPYPWAYNDTNYFWVAKLVVQCVDGNSSTNTICMPVGATDLCWRCGAMCDPCTAIICPETCATNSVPAGVTDPVAQ